MTSKQRAHLRSMASVLQPIFQIGKGGINDAMINSISEALEKRELVKLTVLKTCEDEAKDVLQELAEALDAEPVTAIGNKIVLYRRSNNDKIEHIEF